MRSLKLIGAALIVLSTPMLLHAGEGKIRKSHRPVTGEYIVVLNDDTSLDDIPVVAQRLIAQHGGAVQRVWKHALKGLFLNMTEEQALALSRSPLVKYVEENGQLAFSSQQPTNVDPACTPPASCATSDNRLWHLDVLDQNAAVGTHTYSYCNDGTGVYVYVVDLGVMRAHREFNNSSSRVVDGYNASGDGPYYPAYDPCHGSPTANDYDSSQEAFGNSHGTGVASVVAGQNVGVAKNATIVPVKVGRCGEYSARPLQRNTAYSTGVIVHANGTWYQATNSGTTGATTPTTWSWPPTPCCTLDGTLSLQYLGNNGYSNSGTVQMLIEGLDWILRPAAQGGNPNPKSPAVVTLSTYRVVGEDGVSNTPTGASLSIEDAIANLLKYNSGQGITVIASANNQDADACDTSPGRMSRNNPNNPNDPSHPYKVITAGGTMLRNNPDANPANGGSHVSLPEPTYDSSKATQLARWRCNAGDSDPCSADIYALTPPTTPDPATHPLDYEHWTLGSNGGQCVTLFAPAKNIPVATITADGNGNPTLYRDSRATGGLASGTSWSAPFVAGAVARILQNNPTYNVDQVYTALMSNTTADLDPSELNPPGVTGTPNALLHIPDVTVGALPYTVTGPVTASAAGTAPLTYQWYQVNSNFDVNTYHANAAAATVVAGATSATLSVNPAVATSYFARVASSCGSADSNITTVNPCQSAAITAQPTCTPSSINLGASSTLAIGVTGAAPVSVAWHMANGTSVGSGTSLSVSPTTTTSYYAVVSNTCNSVQSASCTVAVCVPPGLGTAPTATPSTITAGQTSKLETGSATGSGTLTYLWYNSGGTLVGTSTNKKLNVSPTVTTAYYYKVGNSCGTTGASPTVTVTVH